jgi:hypothetical protein
MSDPAFDHAWKQLRHLVAIWQRIEKIMLIPLVLVFLSIFFSLLDIHQLIAHYVLVCVFISMVLLFVYRARIEMRIRSFLCPRCKNSYFAFVPIHPRSSMPQWLYDYGARVPCCKCKLPLFSPSSEYDKHY